MSASQLHVKMMIVIPGLFDERDVGAVEQDEGDWSK